MPSIPPTRTETIPANAQAAECSSFSWVCSLPLVQPLAIILGCTLAAVCFGLVHDQLTIRLSPHYFTLTHPRIIESDSLILIALAWGFAATWWVGAALGLLVAVAARMGSEPRVPTLRLIRPVLLLLAITGAFALTAGTLGSALTRADIIGIIDGELLANIPADMHDRWLAALWTHTTSYASGGIGGLVLVAWTLRMRWRLAHSTRTAQSSVTGCG